VPTSDQIYELNLEDLWILDISIAEQKGISRERVRSTITKDLSIQKLSAKWVPKCLKEYQKAFRASRLSKFWNFSLLARSK
jgi:hypothetical protein